MFCGGGGITPAYAGNTITHLTINHIRRDHPRVCGEHTRRLHTMTLCAGSPPRMRGTRYGGCYANNSRRITPAYAGNTGRVSRSISGSRDHPRVCGEHVNTFYRSVHAWGSPPRMRGTLSNSAALIVPMGITPAYAGNTWCNPCRLLVFWDHPRVCGEHLLICFLARLCAGSPPRMRGTPSSDLDLHVLWDHPRVCGEHTY